VNQEAFRRFLEERKTPTEQIASYIAIAEEFEAFARQVGHTGPTAADVRAFSAQLIAEKRNTWDNYLAVLRYGRFIKNNAVTVAALELLDGTEAMEVLYEKMGRELGEQKRDEIWQGIPLPPLGTPTTELYRTARAVMERLEATEGPETIRRLLSDCLRRLDPSWYLPEREKYLQCGSLDAYLELKGQEFIAQLEQIQREGGLFFNQEITPEVIEYVRTHPGVAREVRVGNILYHVKIPHMAREYLVATDAQMKRYYYCHCPWAKESLRAGEVPVPASFCHCSAGFTKKPWEAVFGQPLEVDVVESVLQGDLQCKFAIHLPAGNGAQ
jgi:hypothetical protein